MKKPSDDEIAYWRERREEGAAYRQIVNESFIKFGKRRSPETVRKHAADVEVEEDLEEEKLPGEPISEERKKEQMEIMKKFLDEKPLEEILREHHYDLVFSVRKDYYEKVLTDRISRWEERLRFLGVWDENAEDPIQEGIWKLSDSADKASLELKNLKDRVEQGTNEIFREYKEKQEEDGETISGLQKELRERNRRDKQWGRHVKSLNSKHEKEIKRWQQYVRDILYFKVKYDEAMAFTEAADPLVEAYRKGQFNMMVRLYELPFSVRDQFDTKLARTARSRNWKGHMNVAVDLIKKVDLGAEQWIKRESAVVMSSKHDALRELYQQLVNLGYTGTLKDLKEILEKNLSKPQLQREVQVLEKRIATLKPEVKELEFKQKLLKAVIPELQEQKEKAITQFSRVCDSTDKLFEKLQKHTP